MHQAVMRSLRRGNLITSSLKSYLFHTDFSPFTSSPKFFLGLQNKKADSIYPQTLLQIKCMPLLTSKLMQINMSVRLFVRVPSLPLLVVAPRKTELKGILESLFTNMLKKEKKIKV